MNCLKRHNAGIRWNNKMNFLNGIHQEIDPQIQRADEQEGVLCPFEPGREGNRRATDQDSDRGRVFSDTYSSCVSLKTPVYSTED